MIQVDPKYGWVLKRWPWGLNACGYPQARTFGKTMKLHRYLRMLEFGSIPAVIDHINQDKLDNRICNLRPANRRLNNTNKDRRNKVTGLPTGVNYCPLNSRGYPLKRPYQAKIMAYGFSKGLGMYATPEEASQAYEEARQMVIEFESLKSED